MLHVIDMFAFFLRPESLLVMRDIGIQVKTTYWSGRTESKFINRLKIENVVINEGITLWQVKPYMAILVKDQEKMTIAFEVSVCVCLAQNKVINRE